MNTTNLDRFLTLRKDFLEATDHAAKREGLDLSGESEGGFALMFPTSGVDGYSLNCISYLLAPKSVGIWEAETFDKVLDMAEKDIKEWIKTSNDFDKQEGGVH